MNLEGLYCTVKFKDIYDLTKEQEILDYCILHDWEIYGLKIIEQNDFYISCISYAVLQENVSLKSGRLVRLVVKKKNTLPVTKFKIGDKVIHRDSKNIALVNRVDYVGNTIQYGLIHLTGTKWFGYTEHEIEFCS